MIDFLKEISKETPISKMIGVSRKFQNSPKFSKIEDLENFEVSKVLVKPHYVGSTFVLRYDENGDLEELNEPLLVLFERFNHIKNFVSLKVVVKITVPLNIFNSFYNNFTNPETLVNGILECSDLSKMSMYAKHIVVKEVYFDGGDTYKGIDEYLDLMDGFSGVFDNEEWETKIYEGKKTVDKMIGKCRSSGYFVDGLIFLNVFNKKINLYNFENLKKNEDVEISIDIDKVVKEIKEYENDVKIEKKKKVLKDIGKSEELEELLKLDDFPNTFDIEDIRELSEPVEFEGSSKFVFSEPQIPLLSPDIQSNPDNLDVAVDDLGVVLISPTVTEEVVFDDLFGDFKDEEEIVYDEFEEIEKKEIISKFERECKFLKIKLDNRDMNKLMGIDIKNVCDLFEGSSKRIQDVLGREIVLKKFKFSYEKFVEFAYLRGFNKLRISKICENSKNIYNLLETSVERMVVWLGESDRVVRGLWKVLQKEEKEVLKKLDLMEEMDWNLKKD